MSDRYCKDCISFTGTSCRYPKNLRDDLVMGGQRTRQTVEFLREDFDSIETCGTAGKWFQAKEPA